ncbi:molybdenum cofactor biosynthesis protein MoaE [soil metagenome]
MHVRVRFFALQRIQTGLRELELELPESATVEAAWAALVAAFPQLAPASSSVRFARNGSYVDASEDLAEGDELAVIPPVAGGAELGTGRVRRLEMVPGPLGDGLTAELLSMLPTSADGAVAAFVGRTRESAGTPAPGQEAEAARFAGQRVTGLSYEAYEGMAIAVLEQIADEIEVRFGVRRLAIVHRVGDVAVGEDSVVIVAAAAHREEAFGACRYAIEELKARAPIWKSEHFADGSVWLGAPARMGPQD